jgi:hypothetical protein
MIVRRCRWSVNSCSQGACVCVNCPHPQTLRLRLLLLLFTRVPPHSALLPRLCQVTWAIEIDTEEQWRRRSSPSPSWPAPRWPPTPTPTSTGTSPTPPRPRSACLRRYIRILPHYALQSLLLLIEIGHPNIIFDLQDYIFIAYFKLAWMCSLHFCARCQDLGFASSSFLAHSIY